MADIDCSDPGALAEAAKCYCFANEKQATAIIIFLLWTIAESELTPEQLAQEAKCFCFADKRMADAVIAYLLCQIVNGA